MNDSNVAFGGFLCRKIHAAPACPSRRRFKTACRARRTSFFRVIGSDTRLKILLALDGRELCAGHLAEAVGMTPSAVSNQLKALRQARLITARREGKMLYYSLADCHPREIIHLAMSHVKEEN